MHVVSISGGLLLVGKIPGGILTVKLATSSAWVFIENEND